MPETTVIAAEIRERAGKGAARQSRRSGRIPGIIYGNKMDPVMISVDTKEIAQHLDETGFFTQIVEVTANGDSHRVLVRDVQTDPVTDVPLHIDFLRFSADTRIVIEVPCVFENEEESPGLKRGGVLNIVRREVELLCSPASIPRSLVFDLTGLDIGDSIHIAAIQLPEGVEATTDRDFTVATIAAPTILTVEEDDEGVEGEEGIEGEEGVEGEEAVAGEDGDGDSGSGGDKD